MMQTTLVSIFISRVRKLPKTKPPDKKSFKKYRSPLDHWRAIIKSILAKQRDAKSPPQSPKLGSVSCLPIVTSRRSSRTSKADKCGDRGRRATILALFPTTGRSVFTIPSGIISLRLVLFQGFYLASLE